MTTGTDSDSPRSTASRAAETASTEASNVAQTTMEGAKDVAGKAGEQLRTVAEEARGQIDHLMGESRTELNTLARQESERAANGLRSIAQQFTALAEGRPQEAGTLVQYLQRAQGKVDTLAGRLDSGPQAVLDDVASFARRRPGAFLAAAVGAGFVVGRLARSTAAASSQSGGGQGQQGQRAYPGGPPSRPELSPTTPSLGQPGERQWPAAGGAS